MAMVADIERESLRERIFTYLFPVLLFLTITAQSRFMAVIMSAVLLVFVIGKKPISNLKSSVTVLTLAILLYITISLAAGLYSNFGSYAVSESAKVVSAGALFLLTLAMMGKKKLGYILASIAGVCALISILCIDAASMNLLSKPYAALMNIFLYDVTTSFGFEQGIRITGIFGNPNVAAGLLAFGVLISCYLTKGAKNEKSRILYSLLLGINSMGFLLCFSMGAIVAFVLSCIVFIIFEKKGQRTALLLLMLGSVFSSVLLSFAIYPFLGKPSVVPIILSVVNGAVIYLLLRFVVDKLGALIDKGGKKAMYATLAAVLVLAVYASLALTITGAASIAGGAPLNRAEYLSAGEYKLSLEAEGGVDVTIYSQNRQELMMHKNTLLYQGSAVDAVFTVPENAEVTWFSFTTPDSARISSALLSDGTKLKLTYTLMPAFAANRLQGLFANQNFIQRLVFFEDGMKLFLKNPIFGGGLGAVEGGLTSVQDFYYESVYIHNHFIQVLDEMGVVGLVIFVFMMVTAILVLIKNKKTGNASLLALLGSCVAMMIFHSITEVVWSTGIYQTACYLIFAVIILKYGKPLKLTAKKPYGTLAVSAMCLLVVCFGALIGGNLLASKLLVGYEPENRAALLSMMIKLDTLDCYDDNFYKSTYMMNAVGSEKLDESNRAKKYANQLKETGEYRACTDVAMYYYLPKQLMGPMFETSRKAIEQEASNPDSWNLQLEFYRQAISYISPDKTGEYLNGVMQTLDYYESFNKDRLEQITLSEENQAFAACVRTLVEDGVAEAEAYTALSILYAPQAEGDNNGV